jgi:hypothetical protein
MVTSDASVEQRTDETDTDVGIDALALKPTECDLATLSGRSADVGDVDGVVVDYEGRAAMPTRETLAALAARWDLRVTTPVRADGFDPRGDDGLWNDVPDGAGRVLVAGNPAYLTDEERSRAVAPRLGAAVDRAPDAWVGTESVERIALATGGTQFELLGRDTERTVRGLRAAGFDGDVAVYAPTVRSDDDDEILNALGGYVARRRSVRAALPDDDPVTDATATGRTREVLTAAARDFALVGDEATIEDRVAALRAAGVTTVVAYPARGLELYSE